MKVKVCGMREADNIRELGRLPIDWMGFIFYPPSSRYAGGIAPGELRKIPSYIRKAGVFVDAPTEEIRKTIDMYGLDAVQLHGNETPEICESLRGGVEVIKAFSLSSGNDLTTYAAYEDSCDYYVFDTKTPLYGGSGRQYDWNILSSYRGKTPFLLSGGIGPEDAERILSFSHPSLEGIDLNSCFERRPGLKDIDKVETFLKRIRRKGYMI